MAPTLGDPGTGSPETVLAGTGTVVGGASAVGLATDGCEVTGVVLVDRPLRVGRGVVVGSGVDVGAGVPDGSARLVGVTAGEVGEGVGVTADREGTGTDGTGSGGTGADVTDPAGLEVAGGVPGTRGSSRVPASRTVPPATSTTAAAASSGS